jgi:hypothetical protein
MLRFGYGCHTPPIEGRPLRRYYQLSLDGAERARRALTDAQRSLALGTRAR